MFYDDETERMRKWSWPMSRYCSESLLKGLKKKTHTHTKNQDNQYPSQELNWVLPKYRPKILLPEPISSVLATMI